MKESVFQKEIKNSFRDLGAWCEKFPDMPRFTKNEKCERCGHIPKDNFSSRFIPEKPFDLNVMYRGIGLAIECKMLKGYQAFSRKKMRESEERNLDLYDLAGGKSFVFLNVRCSEPGKRVNHLIVFEWSILQSIWQSGSIKKVDLEMYPFTEGHKQRFDLNGFCESLIEEADICPSMKSQ